MVYFADVRGQLTFQVHEVTWSAPERAYEPHCSVRIKWWGEAGDGVTLWCALLL